MAIFYGRQVVLEILKSQHKVQTLLLSDQIDPEWKASVWDLARKKSISIKTVSNHSLDNLTRGNHQGVAIEAAQIQPIEFKSFCQNLSPTFKGFVVLLDEIQDPQNLGAMLRSAVCFDCSGVIVPTRRSSPLGETVMRASSGAMAHCPIVEIANLGVAIERLQERGFFIVGADPTASTFLDEVPLQFPLAILLGNEHRGIKSLYKKNCDQLLKIRQSPKFDSLNVSCAATVFFNTIYRKMGTVPLGTVPIFKGK